MKEPISGSVQEVCDNTTVQTVEGSRIARVRGVGYNYVSCVDIDNLPTRIEIGFAKGSRFIPLTSQVPSAAAISVDLDAMVHVPSGYWLAARVYGGTSGDTLRLTWAGYIER